MLEVEPVDPARPDFVAEARGLDLREPLDAAACDAFVAAMDRFAVLVFRDQILTNEQQKAFSANFGPLERARDADRPGHVFRLDAEMADVSNLDEAGRVMGPDARRRMSALANRLWHTDSSFKRQAARYSFLSAHIVPPRGGETEFADMRAAWDALPADMRARLDGLVAEHSIFQSRGQLGFTDFTEEERAALPPVLKPLVQTHPATGRKSLFIASHAARIEGMPVADAKLLLMDLMEHATRPEFVHVHRWRVGDLVVWDNRCTMHRGRSFDEDLPRDVRRTTVSDDSPPAPLA